MAKRVSFEKQLKKAFADDTFRMKSSQSLKIFKDKAKDILETGKTEEGKKRAVATKGVRMGSMYSFFYDPKLKSTLPYYDRFPVVFPIAPYNNGFLGLNLHYLPNILRARLLDTLMTEYVKTRRVGRGDEKYVQMSYAILKASSASAIAKPTIKRYLTSHLKSAFIKIDHSEWENIAFIPSQFQKQPKSVVWRDSKRIISDV